MARYTGPSCKLCRREGKKLFLKGDRCLTDKCAVVRRSTVPGQHGAGRKTVKEYGSSLVRSRPHAATTVFRRSSSRSTTLLPTSRNGIAGENLLSLLERRFDNVVYRMGLASSRKEARQLVRHAHFELNGKKADIPSIILKPGDVVSLREKSRASDKFKELAEQMAAVIPPKWLDVDTDNFTREDDHASRARRR